MKKILYILVVTLLLLSGCSNHQSHVEYLEKKIEKLESENSELKIQLREAEKALPSETEVPAETQIPNLPTESPAPSTPTPAPMSAFQSKQEITIERICSFALQSTEFTMKVEPSDPPKYGVTYFRCDNDGMIYYDLVFKIKNISTANLPANEFIDVIVLYDNAYEYPTFSVYEQDDGSDFWKSTRNVNPLQTVTLHFIAEVPIYIADDDKPVDIIVSCSGNDFICNFK